MSEELVSRPYQEQLEEIASRKNTIIHLPTGSGKTFIAICLIRRFREALQKPWGLGGKRTFFLVNTVPLVVQQKKVIEDLCPVNGVGAYSGEIGVDHWDLQKWNHEMEENQVIVMTCQILSDMLNHSFIKIEDINLLIFDECHHAVEDHPMRMVMKHFEMCAPAKQPRVLGLTATLLNANTTIAQVQPSLKELETTFHATIATVNELGEVLTYSTNPNESVQYHTKPIPTRASVKVNEILDKAMDIIMSVKLTTPSRTRDFLLKKGQHDITTDPNKEEVLNVASETELSGVTVSKRRKLSATENEEYQLKEGQIDITTDPKKKLKAVKNMFMSMKTFVAEFGDYGGSLGILAYIILLERLKRQSSTQDVDNLYRTAISFLTEARLVFDESMKNDIGYDKIIKHSSQKIISMLRILKEYNPDVINKPGVLLKTNTAKKKLCAIIFTQQRFTAKILYNLLKAVKDCNEEEFGFLKHDFIVGFTTNPMKCTREQHYVAKASKKALLMFGRNELNCLISTSVIEEGVDIPQCLLVLRFDPPQEYRSYIQSKGRARSKDSSYVIMVDSGNKTKFLKNYMEFQRIEQQIHRILIGNTDSRAAPTQDELQELYDEDILPPYVTPQGARLPSASAISLLNRYFSTLPHDQFTQVTPSWIHEKCFDEKNETKRLITIILPIMCPVKEPIKGQPQISLKNAKRSAALVACIKLHQAGELDVSLLPKSYGTVDFDENDVKDIFLNWPWQERADEQGDDVPKPGTKRSTRKHKIAFPKCLNAVPDSPLYYLHVIKVNPAFPEPKESRERALYKFLQAEEGFGFLTQQRLPKLCVFPSFLTVGEVTTEIVMNYAVINLNETLISLVKRFHHFLFDQLLSIAKKFLIFEGKVNCLYVVPVKDSLGYDIDWDVIQRYTEIPPVTMPDFTIRRSLRVSAEEYKYKVVSPWYRGNLTPDRYIVSNVLEHMTPKSFFHSESDQTYADYYSSKYNLEILGEKNQPLLEVRNINSRMNCLLPRAATINTLTDKQAKLISLSFGDDKPKGAYTEIFIAEFCIKYDFPSVLWYKASMVPSIIHRLHMLLVAQELIADVASEIQYGTAAMPKKEEWLPIQLNMPVAIDSLLSHIEGPNTPMNSVDRINQPIAPTGKELPKILSMKESLYQLQKNKINVEYPWDESSEPVDIERNIQTVTLMDVDSYDEFVSMPMTTEECQPTPLVQRVVPVTAAIKPPPLKYIETIKILQQKPTGRGPELRDIVSALTTIKSHDIFSLERAETLGDSFLKFAATLYLHHKFPERNEGQLTNIKGRLISNRNLYYAGERLNIGGKMKVEQFSPRKDFLMPGFFVPKELDDFIEAKMIRPTFMIGISFSNEEILRGEVESETLESVMRRYTDGECVTEAEPQNQAQNAMQCYLHKQAVADKSVADCVEALIGTYLLSGGILAAIKFLEYLRVFPAKDKLAELLYKPMPTVITRGKAQTSDINFLLDGCQPNIEKILNYKFKDPSFLLEAVSHASYIRNRLTHSYERLEFLGDAILDFLITSHIFENSPDLKPGELTDLRSALVNNVTFAAYVVKLGLHKYICKELNPHLDQAIMEFVEHQVQRKHEIVEDVLYLIDEEESPMAEYVEVPKALSDLFESLAGAIYLDSGGNLQTVWSVIYPIMCNEIYEFTLRIPRQPVCILYEMVHACPKFGKPELVNPDMPGMSKMSVGVTFTKKDRMHTVYGIGKNKSQAKRAAAKLALKVINA